MSVQPLASATLPRPRLAPTLAFVLSVLALTVAGAVISFGLIARGAPAPTGSVLKGPFGISQDIPTSFGAVAVDNVEKLGGIKPKDLSGMTHFPSYVKPNQVQVQTSISITNLLGEPISYAPTQFRLLVGKKRRPVDDLRASFRPGTLQPDASISGQIKFVAPRNGSKLWLQFTDPGRRKPILIDLGKTGRTPPGAFDGFHKGH